MNMKTIRTKYTSWLWIATLSLFFSCDRMNDLHDEYLQRGETTYLSRIDEINLYPGNKRAELVFVNKDPKATTLVVYWRSRTDSMVFPIPDNSVGQELKVELTNLPEDFLTFELVTTTADGESKSLTTELSARIYGEQYEASLNNRLVDKAIYLESGNELDVTWKGIFEGAVNIEIVYEGTDGNARTMNIPIEERSILYLNMFKDDLKYRTGYIPAENAIDTFYTEYSDLPFSEQYVIEGLAFNGTNQYMTIADHPDFNINSGEVLSISLWVKTPINDKNQRLVLKRYVSDAADPVNGNSGYGIVTLPNGRLYADLFHRYLSSTNPGGRFTTVSDNNYYLLDTWIHLVAVFDAPKQQLTLYQNGNIFGTLNKAANIPANASIVSISDVYVGSWRQSAGGNISEFFKGEIAHLRFWKKTLTPEDIHIDMSTPVTAETPGLVAAYDFRKVEGSGTDLTVPDITGNHTGVLHGFSRP